MKILIIENNLAGGGAEKVLLTLLENLMPPKYDVTLLLIKNKGIYLNDVPSRVKVRKRSITECLMYCSNP